MTQYVDYGWNKNDLTTAHVYILPYLNRILKNFPQPILDFGCGNGAIANYFLSKGFNIYGIDASESGIKEANKINPGHFYVCHSDFDELPLEIKNIPFKTILSTEVIEHLYNPQNFIKKCADILIKNNGGYLILSTPYHGYLKNLMISVFNKWDKHFSPLWIGGHIKFWSYKTIKKLLLQYNFQIKGFKGVGRLPYLWKSMIIIAYVKQ